MATYDFNDHYRDDIANSKHPAYNILEFALMDAGQDRTEWRIRDNKTYYVDSGIVLEGKVTYDFPKASGVSPKAMGKMIFDGIISSDYVAGEYDELKKPPKINIQIVDLTGERGYETETYSFVVTIGYGISDAISLS